MTNSMQSDDAVLTVFGWRVQTRAARQEVLVRLPFVRPDGKPFKGASTDRIYAFGADQAREMSRALIEASKLVSEDPTVPELTSFMSPPLASQAPTALPPDLAVPAAASSLLAPTVPNDRRPCNAADAAGGCVQVAVQAALRTTVPHT